MNAPLCYRKLFNKNLKIHLDLSNQIPFNKNEFAMRLWGSSKFKIICESSSFFFKILLFIFIFSIACLLTTISSFTSFILRSSFLILKILFLVETLKWGWGFKNVNFEKGKCEWLYLICFIGTFKVKFGLFFVYSFFRISF